MNKWTSKEINTLKNNIHKYFTIREYKKVHNCKRSYNAIKTKMRILNLNCKVTKHDIGYEYFTSDTLFVKVKEDADMHYFYTDGWKPKWQIVYGSVPKNSVCIFLDNNPRNVVLENMYVISKGAFNSFIKSGFYYTDDIEIKKTVLDIITLKLSIKEKLNDNK